jgi:hypothetical protein
MHKNLRNHSKHILHQNVTRNSPAKGVLVSSREILGIVVNDLLMEISHSGGSGSAGRLVDSVGVHDHCNRVSRKVVSVSHFYCLDSEE